MARSREAEVECRMEGVLFRRAAVRCLPLLFLGYLFAYTDRVNIGFAAAQMNADLKFSAAVYGLGGGLFFLSYALMEIPSNLMFQRFGARTWIGRIMLTWGLVAAATIFIRNAWQFYAMRLTLGAAEAGFFPAVVIYLARWFPLTNRSRALSLFYVAFPLSGVFMGAVAGSLLGLDGRLGLRGWQWLLLAEGLPAALLSLGIFLWLPESPEGAKWLSAAEKTWLAARLASAAETRPEPTLAGIAGVIATPLVLLLGLVNAFFLGTGYAFTLTAPQVLGIRTGFDPAAVGWIVSAGGIVGAAAMLGNAAHADHRREHHLHLVYPLILMAASLALLAGVRSPAAAIAGYLGVAIGASAFNAVFFVLASRLLEPRSLIVGVAAINMIGQLGSFVLPTLYGLAQTQAGRVDGALWTLPAPFLMAALIVLGLRVRTGAVPKSAPAT